MRSFIFLCFLLPNCLWAHTETLMHLLQAHIYQEKACTIASLLDNEKTGVEQDRFIKDLAILEAKEIERIQNSNWLAAYKDLTPEEIDQRLENIKKRIVQLYRSPSSEHKAELFFLLERVIFLTELENKTELSVKVLYEPLWMIDLTTIAMTLVMLGGGIGFALESFESPSAINIASSLAMIATGCYFTQPLSQKLANTISKMAYHRWQNPRLKQFISDLASTVKLKEKEALAQSRWFFQLYFKLRKQRAQKAYCLKYLDSGSEKKS